MNDDDLRASPLSNYAVRQLAKRAREFFAIAAVSYVDIISCLQNGKVWTVRGVKLLEFVPLPDPEMADDDGRTVSSKDRVIVHAKRSVRHDAFLGVGRARNTLAHELGHAVLCHDRAPMSRRATSNVSPKWLSAYESAEHQVRVFAPAFLINDEIAAKLKSAEEISTTFGVSLESAEIYFERLLDSRERAERAEVMRHKVEQLREALAPSRQPSVQYINEFCSVCGKQNTFPCWAQIYVSNMRHSYRSVSRWRPRRVGTTLASSVRDSLRSDYNAAVTTLPLSSPPR